MSKSKDVLLRRTAYPNYNPSKTSEPKSVLRKERSGTSSSPPLISADFSHDLDVIRKNLSKFPDAILAEKSVPYMFDPHYLLTERTSSNQKCKLRRALLFSLLHGAFDNALWSLMGRQEDFAKARNSKYRRKFQLSASEGVPIVAGLKTFSHIQPLDMGRFAQMHNMQLLNFLSREKKRVCAPPSLYSHSKVITARAGEPEI